MYFYLVFCVLIGILVSIVDVQTTFQSDSGGRFMRALNDNQQSIYRTELRSKVEDALNKSWSTIKSVRAFYDYEIKTSVDRYITDRLEDITEQIRVVRFVEGNRTECIESRMKALIKKNHLELTSSPNFIKDITHFYNESEHDIKQFKQTFSLVPSDLDIIKTTKAEDFVNKRLYDILIAEKKEIYKIVFNYNKRINSTVEFFNNEQKNIRTDLRYACGIQRTVNKVPLTNEETESLKMKLKLEISKFILRNHHVNSTINEIEKINQSFIKSKSLDSYSWSESLQKLILCGKYWGGYTKELVEEMNRSNEELISLCYKKFINSTNAIDKKLKSYESDPLAFLGEENITISSDFETLWFRLIFDSKARFLGQLDEMSFNYMACMDQVIPLVTSCEPRQIDFNFSQIPNSYSKSFY